MNIEMMAKQVGLPIEKARRAFSLAIETVLEDYFALSNIILDLEEKTVQVIFRVPVDMEYGEALVFDDAVLQADPLSVIFDLRAFPAKLVTRIRNMFSKTLLEMKRHHDYGQWRTKKHKLVQGVITEYNDNDCIEVEMDGATGYFPKANWVPREKSTYRKGTSLFFYVQKIERNPVRIILSRRSVRLPELLLKHHLPWQQFTCKKRWIGNKSFIFTDAPFDAKFTEVRDLVRSQLNGEILEVRNFAALQ